jgi:hypothetical protein
VQSLIFVHIPKTAGTSLLQLLDQRSVRMVAAEPWPFSRLRHRKHRPILDWPARIRSRHTSIAVMRDPEAWIRSYYKFIRFTATSPDTEKPWRHGLYPLVKDLDLDGFVAEICENDLFERNVFSFRSLQKAGHQQFDQSSFVCTPQGEIIVDRLMPFEDLDTHLKNFFGLDMSAPLLPVHNRSLSGDSTQMTLSDHSRRLISDRFSRDMEIHGRIA